MARRKRISKEQHYMNIARVVSLRTSCFRAQHGSLIVKNDQIISTGYTGAPRNTKDCFERDNCLRRELNVPSGQRYELCRSVHSEQNAIVNAARAGVSTIGSRIYLYSVKLGENGKIVPINAFPCFICKKEIVNAGISEVACHQIDGTIKVYKTKHWIKNWQKKDLFDDMVQYGVKTVKTKHGKIHPAK